MYGKKILLWIQFCEFLGEERHPVLVFLYEQSVDADSLRHLDVFWSVVEEEGFFWTDIRLLNEGFKDGFGGFIVFHQTTVESLVEIVVKGLLSA